MLSSLYWILSHLWWKHKKTDEGLSKMHLSTWWKFDNDCLEVRMWSVKVFHLTILFPFSSSVQFSVFYIEKLLKIQQAFIGVYIGVRHAAGCWSATVKKKNKSHIFVTVGEMHNVLLLFLAHPNSWKVWSGFSYSNKPCRTELNFYVGVIRCNVSKSISRMTAGLQHEC